MKHGDVYLFKDMFVCIRAFIGDEYVICSFARYYGDSITTIYRFVTSVKELHRWGVFICNKEKQPSESDLCEFFPNTISIDNIGISTMCKTSPNDYYIIEELRLEYVDGEGWSSSYGFITEEAEFEHYRSIFMYKDDPFHMKVIRLMKLKNLLY